MPTLISGSTGVNKITDGTIAAADFASGVGFGLTSQQVFTASGTWTKPSGITTVKVIVTGGGGGGGGGEQNHNNGGGGSAGGTAIEIIDVSSVSSVTVTIGAAGTSGAYSTVGGAGGTSSFGSYCSSTGGAGGTILVQESSAESTITLLEIAG